MAVEQRPATEHTAKCVPPRSQPRPPVACGHIPFILSLVRPSLESKLRVGRSLRFGGNPAPGHRLRTESDAAGMRRISVRWRSRRLDSLLLDMAMCAGGYLYGSVPLVYALARRRHVDLKHVGSGNVGATNLMAAGGPARAAVGWVFDASKGLVPILASRWLGRSRAVSELAGVCGVAGQCWPLFLRFSGGRGISAYVGGGAGMDRVAWAGSLLPMIGGSLWKVAGGVRTSAGHPAKDASRESQRKDRVTAARTRSKSVPLGCFLSVVMFPLLVGARRGFRPDTLVAPTLLSCVIVARRLTATQPDDATAGPAVHPKAWLYRLLYDRNTSD